MRRIAFIATLLAFAATLSACAGTSSVQRNDRFSGMTFSMPVGGAFK